MSHVLVALLHFQLVYLEPVARIIFSNECPKPPGAHDDRPRSHATPHQEGPGNKKRSIIPVAESDLTRPILNMESYGNP